MANLFIEGFDLYEPGVVDEQSGSPWFFVSGPNVSWNAFVTSSSPITGSNSCFVSTSVNNGQRVHARSFTSSDTTFIYGFAVVFEDIGNTSDKRLCLGNTTNTIGVWNSGGFLVVKRNSTVIDTGTTALLQGVKYYIEVKVTDTTYEVRLDGVLEMSGTMTSIGGFDRMSIHSSNSSQNRGRIDDIYLNDSTGTVNNDYLGEISVLALFPDSDLSPQDWVPSTGSTAYEILDNAPATDDYVEGQNTNDEMNVGIETVPIDITDIHVVSLAYRAAKDGSGPCSIQASVNNDSASSAGSVIDPAETTYAWFFDTHELDPSTSLPWDPDTFEPTVTVTRTL